MKKIIIIISALFIFINFSCKKNLPDIGGTNTQKMANEWWVQLFEPSGALAYPASYYGHISTYNTADNITTQMWLDDAGQIWDFKIKINVDLNNLTFTANNAVSIVPGYGIKVNVTEGKILLNAAKSKTGNVTDSIYMKIEFEDDPGAIYTIRGHARTRFSEDDY